MIAFLLSPLMPFLALLGLLALVVVALAIAFPRRSLSFLAAFAGQLLEDMDARRRRRSLRLAKRVRP